VNELRGEKIDVVQWTEDINKFVANALAPAKVKEVHVDPASGTATVIVPDYQLSLAIGKEGQNARLAAKLTGCRIDIKSETQAADEDRQRRESQRAAATAASVETPEPQAPEPQPEPEAAEPQAAEPEAAESEAAESEAPVEVPEAESSEVEATDDGPISEAPAESEASASA
jgi:N utilization substance protein A